jgi:hypothetical protein
LHYLIEAHDCGLWQGGLNIGTSIYEQILIETLFPEKNTYALDTVRYNINTIRPIREEEKHKRWTKKGFSPTISETSIIASASAPNVTKIVTDITQFDALKGFCGIAQGDK